MRQKSYKIKFSSFLITILFISISVFGDTIQLKDGSLLVGKIVTRSKGKITFSNSYGVFSFQAKQVKKEYQTTNYKQDIKIFKKLGHPITSKLVKNIKKNYQEGQKKKEKIKKLKPDKETIDKEKKRKEQEKLEEERRKEMEGQDRKREKELKKLKEYAEKQRKKELKRKEKERRKQGSKSNLWVNGRFYFSGSFLYTFGEINDVIPYGFAGNFAIDQGLDMAIKKRFALMPGIRFEFGYIYFQQGKAIISGYSAYAGFCWALPSMKSKWGNFYLAALPGMAFIDIEKVKSDYKVTSYTVSVQTLFGYQYSIGVFTVFIHSKYLYIYDKDVLFNSFGFEVGIGFNAW